MTTERVFRACRGGAGRWCRADKYGDVLSHGCSRLRAELTDKAAAEVQVVALVATSELSELLVKVLLVTKFSCGC